MHASPFRNLGHSYSLHVTPQDVAVTLVSHFVVACLSSPSSTTLQCPSLQNARLLGLKFDVAIQATHVETGRADTIAGHSETSQRFAATESGL